VHDAPATAPNWCTDAPQRVYIDVRAPANTYLGTAFAKACATPS